MEKKNPLRFLAEDTLLPLSLVLALTGAVSYVVNINSIAVTSASDIKDLRFKEEDHAKQFEEIRIRLTHIEDAVGAKK